MREIVQGLLEANYILEMLAACLLFALPLKKRTLPWLRFFGAAMVSLGVSKIAGMMGGLIQPEVFSAALVYLVQLLVVVLPILVSCDITFEDAVYGTLCAYAMQHFASSLYILLCLGSGVTQDIWNLLNWDTVLLYLCSYGISYAVMYFLFAKPLGRLGRYEANLFRAGGLTVLVLPIALYLSLLAKLRGEGDFNFLLCQVYAMFCSFFVLWVQVSQQREIQIQTEMQVQKELWRKEKEQYQISRDTIEIINRKCHDLKHQVRALRSCTDQQRDESLSEIEQAVMVYDAGVQTGNPVLDTVLTEKSLLCEHRQIQWTCMADGRRLSFLHPVDLYAIVGNALDNAIESVEKLTNPEKRVVGLHIFNRQDLVVLELENYCEEELEFRDGLPVSTKQDHTVHGFGMKSIRQTVEKYGGSLSVKVMDRVFILCIVFPVPSGQPAD